MDASKADPGAHLQGVPTFQALGARKRTSGLCAQLNAQQPDCMPNSRAWKLYTRPREYMCIVHLICVHLPFDQFSMWHLVRIIPWVILGCYFSRAVGICSNIWMALYMKRLYRICSIDSSKRKWYTRKRTCWAKGLDPQETSCLSLPVSCLLCGEQNRFHHGVARDISTHPQTFLLCLPPPTRSTFYINFRLQLQSTSSTWTVTSTILSNFPTG